jgi:hypothetical protein
MVAEMRNINAGFEGRVQYGRSLFYLNVFAVNLEPDH